MSLNQEYSWAARLIVLNPRLQRLSARLSIYALLLLAFCVTYFIYSKFVGVDVDPRLLPQGMSYYQKVEKAIKSPDIGEKLNVLLMGRYESFTNVTDFQMKYRARIGYCVTAFILLFIFSWVSRHLVRYYPRAFVALGGQVERLKKLEKGRELWVTVVIIGFVVNLAAGVVIIFISK
jgi:hypothetical protein